MAPEISDWIALTALASSFVAYMEAKKANRTREALEALHEVVDASESTQTYLQRRADGQDRDRDVEYRLAEHWSKASFMMSRVNKDLSVRLDQKSRFWRDPKTWKVDAKNKVDISLESVAKDARRLLNSYG